MQFGKKDIIKRITEFYSNINPVYKQSFWILFVVTNIVFGYYTINFFWGNHDWPYMVNGMPVNFSIFEGRYGSFVISKILTGGLYLPIVSALWAFAAWSLSAVLLAIYWKIPQRTAYFVIFGLILNLTPYTCVWFFFGHWIVNIAFARLFIFIGFILSAKYASNGSKMQKIFANLTTIILLNFGISVYQSFIGTIVMVIAGRILVEMLDWASLKEGIKNSFQQNKWAVLDIISAAVLYKIVFSFMQQNKLIRENFYNMQTISFTDIPDKIWKSMKAAWQQFTDFSMAFYPDILTKLFLILAVIFLAQILFNKQRTWPVKSLIIIAFFVALLLTKTVTCVAKAGILYKASTDLCGYALFNALIVALCFKGGQFLRDTKIIITGVIIYLFAINCLYHQKTYKLGFDAEKMTWNRMLSRLESHPNFNPEQKYIVMQLGQPISLRNRYYPKNTRVIKDRWMLTESFDPKWKTFTPLNFYNFEFIKKSFIPDSFNNPNFMKNLKHLNEVGLLENAKAWPAQNSIIVYEDIILVIMDNKKLEKAKQILKTETNKE